MPDRYFPAKVDVTCGVYAERVKTCGPLEVYRTVDQEGGRRYTRIEIQQEVAIRNVKYYRGIEPEEAAVARKHAQARRRRNGFAEACAVLRHDGVPVIKSQAGIARAVFRAEFQICGGGMHCICGDGMRARAWRCTNSAPRAHNIGTHRRKPRKEPVRNTRQVRDDCRFCIVKRLHFLLITGNLPRQAACRSQQTAKQDSKRQDQHENQSQHKASPTVHCAPPCGSRHRQARRNPCRYFRVRSRLLNRRCGATCVLPRQCSPAPSVLLPHRTT